MFVTHELFSTFTNRPIADNSTTQVLIAIQVESKEQVDNIVKLALENGATRYKESVDHGWMYFDSFSDLDGHQWEVMFTDPTKIPHNEKITIKANISSNIQKVWDYYTKPEHITKWNYALDTWHCPRAYNDLSVGGKLSWRKEAKDGSYGFDYEGVYNEIEEKKKIIYTLLDDRKVEVNFHSYGNQTVVQITFDPENQNPREMQEEGWQKILDNFKKYTETN